MSDLVAIAYDDQRAAETVRKALADLAKEKIVEFDDAVVVARDQDGKVDLHHTSHRVGSGAVEGATWGTAIGVIFLMPLMGLIIGAASGAVEGALTDVGTDDNFMKRLGRELMPGTSAVVLLIRKSTPEQLRCSGPLGGEFHLGSSIVMRAQQR